MGTLLSLGPLATGGAVTVFEGGGGLAAAFGGGGAAASTFTSSTFGSSSFTSSAGGGEEESALPAAPKLTLATGCPTTTVSSSATRISSTTPAPGERISIVTLSVSTCTMTSSSPTASPAALSTVAIVPSDMESPIWGTSIVTLSNAGPLERRPRLETKDETDESVLDKRHAPLGLNQTGT